MSVSSEGSDRFMANIFAIDGRPAATNGFQQHDPSSHISMQVDPAAAALNDNDPDVNKKRSFSTHSKDGEVLSDKKLRRLEKNRISARECRRRKREATEQKLRQINMLEAENLRLRLQLEIGQEGGEDPSAKQQSTLMQELDDLLTSGASDADIFDKIEEYKEKHADYGSSRRSSIESHLRQIERLLMPTQTTSVVMTAIQAGPFDTATSSVEGDSSGEENTKLPGLDSSPLGTNSEATTMTHATTATAVTDVSSLQAGPISSLDPKALFNHLVSYLQVTPQQAAALKDSRFVARELDGCLEKALEVLQELRSRLAKTGEDLEKEFDHVRKTLTATQAAKFLIWVANNKACIHMLNELWDRVYPSQNIFQDDEVSTGASAKDYV